MKATSVFAIAALALAGTACSEAADKAEIVDATSAETIEVAAEPQAAEDSGFNLNIGLDDEDTSGGLNLNLGGDDSDTRLIGSGELSSGSSFGSDDDLALNVPSDDAGFGAVVEGDAVSEPPVEDNDGIILLPKN